MGEQKRLVKGETAFGDEIKGSQAGFESFAKLIQVQIFKIGTVMVGGIQIGTDRNGIGHCQKCINGGLKGEHAHIQFGLFMIQNGFLIDLSNIKIAGYVNDIGKNSKNKKDADHTEQVIAGK